MPRRLRSRAAWLLSILAIAVAAACSHWGKANEPVPQLLTGEKPPKSAQVLLDTAEVMLTDLRLTGDTLFGLRVHPVTKKVDSVPVGISLSDIREVRVPRTDVGATIALAALIPLVVLVAVVGAAASSMSDASFSPSSCPIVSVWDGSGWQVQASPLTGAIARGLTRTDLDYLPRVTPDGSRIRLRVATKLDEVDHLDAVELLAVDHAPGLEIGPDPAARLHAFGRAAAPLSAVDFQGDNVLERIRARDGRRWYSSGLDRDSSVLAQVQDGLVLRFGRAPGVREAHLVIEGANTLWANHLMLRWISARGQGLRDWEDSLDTDPAFARTVMAPLVRQAFLAVELRIGDRWLPVGRFWEAGPVPAKRQVLHLGLPAAAGDTIEIRLSTVPGFWQLDQIGMSFGSEKAFDSEPLSLATARETDGKDVENALRATDGTVLRMDPGSEVELAFAMRPVPEGMVRSYVLRTTGWYRVLVEEPLANDSLLRRVAGEKLGLSRIAVGMLTDALLPFRGTPPRR